jgi:hypothetical protein
MTDDFADGFADAYLKDLRRSRRLPKLATALAAAPAESITAASGGWAECMAALRLLNNGDCAAAELLRPQLAQDGWALRGSRLRHRHPGHHRDRPQPHEVRRGPRATQR